jgi:hypothetical protein|tara:strand:+ start:36 stop:272 length:237 start_codon:yes stop_codon:yes gene_type:complete
MESNEQEKENLMKMPGDIKQMSSGSFLSKHMGGGVSPLQSKGSMAYQKGETKPDYPDIDGDGNKKESMAQAAKDKKNT